MKNFPKKKQKTKPEKKMGLKSPHLDPSIWWTAADANEFYTSFWYATSYADASSRPAGISYREILWVKRLAVHNRELCSQFADDLHYDCLHRADNPDWTGYRKRFRYHQTGLAKALRA